MIKAILLGLLKFFASMITLLFTPIDLLISAAFPDLAQALGYITAFFTNCANAIGWAVSTVGFPDYILNLIVITLTLKLTLYPTIFVVKLILKWYRKLVP